MSVPAVDVVVTVVLDAKTWVYGGNMVKVG